MTVVVRTDMGKRFGRGAIVAESDEAIAVLLPVYINGSQHPCIMLELGDTDRPQGPVEETADEFRDKGTHLGQLTLGNCYRHVNEVNAGRKQSLGEAKAWHEAAQLLQSLAAAARQRAVDLRKGVIEPSKKPKPQGLDIEPKKPRHVKLKPS